MNKLSSNLLILAVCLSLVACSKKDEPTQPTPPQVENPTKPDPSKPGTNSSNPGTPPSTPGTTPSRPTDYEIGSRAYASWTSEPSEALYKQFDLESLWLSNDKTKYTPQYLSQFVTFRSSSVDGTAYTFTAEDLQKTELLDLKYDEHGEELTFKIKYNSTTSQQTTKLTFRKADYYKTKITANTAVIAQKYVSGVEKHASALLPSLISYDDSRYIVHMQDNGSALADFGARQISIPVVVKQKSDSKELATFSLSLSGFRAFESLQGDLKVIPSHDLNGVAKELYKSYKDKEMQLLSSLKSRILNNRNLLEYEARNKTLAWQDNKDLVCSDNTLDYLDLYFPNMHIAVTSAKFRTENGNRVFLDMTLQIQDVRDAAIEGVSFSIPTFVQNN